MNNNRIYLIGELGFKIEGLEVVSEDSIDFPLTSNECLFFLLQLLDKARKLDASLIFQSLPGQVAVAINTYNRYWINHKDNVSIGVAIMEDSKFSHFEWF